MRSWLFLVVAAASIAAAACAREPREQTSFIVDEFGVVGTAGDDVAATITQLEREWVAAIANKDTAALDRLLAEEFNGTSPTAHVFTKHMALEDIASGIYVVDEMTLDEVSVNVYGDTAVAFASQEEKSRYEGKNLSGHYHYTDVWVKRDGRWQAVASHGSRFDVEPATTYE